MYQRNHRILFLLVQYEDGRVNPPKYGIIEESRLVTPPVGEIGELHTGKLVYVGVLNGSRRSKLLSMSEDYQTLQNELRQLEENTFENYQRKNNLIELENTIKNLQERLELYRQTISDTRRNSRSNPYDDPIPSTSASTTRLRSNTADRVPTSTIDINEHNDYSSYNSPPELPDRLNSLGQSLTELSRHVRYLEDRLHIKRESKVKNNNRRVLVTPSLSTSSEDSYSAPSESVDSDEESEKHLNKRQIPRNSTVARNGKSIENVNFDEDAIPEETPRNNRIKRRILHTSSESCDEGDTVKIGPGRTEVSRHVISQLDWTSHTLATRKLLTAVFPRKVLATHSLTGKSSPAFANKPAKLCLDPVRVQDIIVTVSKKCQVKENLVRNAITTKCADENKMYRTREAKKKQNKGRKENYDPKNNSGSANSSMESVHNFSKI